MHNSSLRVPGGVFCINPSHEVIQGKFVTFYAKSHRDQIGCLSYQFNPCQSCYLDVSSVAISVISGYKSETYRETE